MQERGVLGKRHTYTLQKTEGLSGTVRRHRHLTTLQTLENVTNTGTESLYGTV